MDGLTAVIILIAGIFIGILIKIDYGNNRKNN
jgi:hypothetical protein